MRKGLSPMVTIIILIGVTMVTATIFYTWASDSLRTQNRENTGIADRTLGCSGSSIAFKEDDVSFDTEDNPTRINVLITNNGRTKMFDFDFVVVSDTKNVHVMKPTSDTVIKESDPLDRSESRLIRADIGDNQINGIDTIRIRAKQKTDPTMDCLVSHDVSFNE